MQVFLPCFSHSKQFCYYYLRFFVIMESTMTQLPMAPKHPESAIVLPIFIQVRIDFNFLSISTQNVAQQVGEIRDTQFYRIGLLDHKLPASMNYYHCLTAFIEDLALLFNVCPIIKVLFVFCHFSSINFKHRSPIYFQI